MAAMLTLAVIVLAPSGRRRATAGWWLAAGLAGGGYWYLRNLIVAGNPLPQLGHLGPIALPHPERLQEGRPDFSIAHYATDTGVWRHYFEPGLHQAFGFLWPVVVLTAIAGGVTALVWGRPRILRWIGAVALVGMVAYVFTPLSAAGAEGAPTGFAINIRYAIPALLAGLTLLPVALLALRALKASAVPAGGAGEELARPDGPSEGSAPSAGEEEGPRTTTSTPPAPPAGGVGVGVARSGAASCFSHEPLGEGDRPQGEKPSRRAGHPHPRDRTRGRLAWSLFDWVLLGALLVLLIVTDRSDAALRDPNRFFAWLIALLAVLIPAVLLFARQRGAPRAALIAGFAALAIAVIAIGYPVQRDYLRDRFANTDPEASIPGMHLDSAYRWARGVHGARIGLVGTTAGFLEYGFYGTDLSDRVRYLGIKGPHGAYNAIPTCAGFRRAVDEADLDYLVTAPFLDFIEPGRPIASPEARWLRGEPAVTPILRSGPVAVWRVRGRLDPRACGPANAPLREVPNQPTA
jgi:hypothetical protein